MNRRRLGPNIEWLGSIDWNRRLFDALIPTPHGTSYNAYLVRGQDKTVLVDTVDPAKKDDLFHQLAGVERLDAVIIQHVEQDHSGALPDVLDRYPDASVLATPKAVSMIEDHLGVPAERITPVEDGETLDLGGEKLEFLHAPWVHWPETMLTYVRGQRVLLTCDLFGSHLATSSLFASGDDRMLPAAKRYFAEIMMPFSSAIRGYLNRLESGRYPIEMIAPSHGPVVDSPETILSAYRRWTGDDTQNLVVIPYATMHGSTGRMVDHLASALTERQVAVQPFDMAITDLGDLAMSLVDARTVVFAAPAVLVGPHPAMVTAAYLVGALRPKFRVACVIGSYGWACQTQERIESLVKRPNLEWLSPVLIKGQPRKETWEALDRLADEIADRHAAA
ncbi:FprA family A-type flavoprotein [Candidatus Bipolaricaulota bacterium]|nr:FprA family A-type flavoprotein [Candidatus Bipolaricaulota bacterium]